MLKVMGLKGIGMGGSFAFILWMCFREMVICRDLQFGEKCWKNSSSWVVISCLTSSIEDYMVVFMVALMDESMEAIVALSCFTSFWVSRKPDCMVLKRASRSWLWVWAMRMGELKRGGRGDFFFQKMIWMKVIREKR